MRGEWESFVRGRGSDLYRIREYMPEDSARHVDWKATAKSGSLKVREFSREDERKLCIVFDNPAAGLISEAGLRASRESGGVAGVALLRRRTRRSRLSSRGTAAAPICTSSWRGWR